MTAGCTGWIYFHYEIQQKFVVWLFVGLRVPVTCDIRSARNGTVCKSKYRVPCTLLITDHYAEFLSNCIYCTVSTKSSWVVTGDMPCSESWVFTNVSDWWRVCELFTVVFRCRALDPMSIFLEPKLACLQWIQARDFWVFHRYFWWFSDSFLFWFSCQLRVTSDNHLWTVHFGCLWGVTELSVKTAQ